MTRLSKLAVLVVLLLSAGSQASGDAGQPPLLVLDAGSAVALVVAQQDFLRHSAETGGLLSAFDKYTVEIEKGQGFVRVTFVPPQGTRGGVGIYEVSTQSWQVLKRSFLK